MSPSLTIVLAATILSLVAMGIFYVWRAWESTRAIARLLDRIAPALLEPEAFYTLIELSGDHSHFLERHGPMLKVAEILERAQSGNLEVSGLAGRPVSSARWFRHHDLLHAVNTARERWAAGERPKDGVFSFQFESEVGEGYAKGSAVLICTRHAIIVIKKGAVVTAYPKVPLPSSE
jgi:hypothetical protein